MFSNRNQCNRTFEHLFQKWNRKVYNYAFQKTSSSYIAEETVQRVFIKLWDNLNTKNIDINVQTQIFIITRSIVLDILKEEYRRKRAIDNINIQEIDNHLQFQLEAKETKENIQRLIDKMPETRKLVFKMSRFQQLNYKEIASSLSISTKTVENHISLALKTIRKSFPNFFILFTFIYQISNFLDWFARLVFTN